VDCEKFSPPRDADDPAARQRPPTVLYVGRLVSRKNVGLIIDAAAVLRDRGSEFRVEICGEGDCRSVLEAQTRSLGLCEHVEFHGHVDLDALPDHYRRSDVFVLPSRYEGMPMVVLEAQACGLPAVVARFEGAEDVIRHDYNGLILPRDTPAALADLLERLLNDPRDRSAMGRHARQRMIDEFSWQRIVDQYLALCRDRFGIEC
jgi:glycosyltransferase involved in cell wall biosynthesis